MDKVRGGSVCIIQSIHEKIVIIGGKIHLAIFKKQILRENTILIKKNKWQAHGVFDEKKKTCRIMRLF